MTFDDLGLSEVLIATIKDLGYLEPTPIQAQAIPAILMNRDVLGCAQTGTGKTASFTLPMIEILAQGRAKARMPRSLILSPTRELAQQIADNFLKYGKNYQLSMALLIGGESMKEQEVSLDKGVDVLIATPGRLIDLFDRGRIMLHDVSIFVIDEADRMLDMGFIPDVERISSLLPFNKQTLFFSATMATSIRELAGKFLHSPKEISVSSKTQTADTVEQFLIKLRKVDKRKVLRHLLNTEQVTNAFIFVNRKRDISVLLGSLTKHGYDAVALHGDLSQSQRTQSLQYFKDGQAKLLVCSDVAGRGIDITGLSHVFNFDVPVNTEDYVHRIGRTGRAGEKGRAFTFATPIESKTVDAIEALIGKPIPLFEIEKLETAEEAAVPNKEHKSRKTDKSAKANLHKGGKERRERRPVTGNDAVEEMSTVPEDYLQEDDSEAMRIARGPFEGHVPEFFLAQYQPIPEIEKIDWEQLEQREAVLEETVSKAGASRVPAANAKNPPKRKKHEKDKNSTQKRRVVQHYLKLRKLRRTRTSLRRFSELKVMIAAERRKLRRQLIA